MSDNNLALPDNETNRIIEIVPQETAQTEQAYLTVRPIETLGRAIIHLYEFMDSAQKTINKLANSLLSWIKQLDFPLFLESLLDPDVVNNLYNAYLQVLYDAKWVPYIGRITSLSLMVKIDGIIKSTKEGSETRKKQIDQAIVSYFNKAEVNKFRSRWWKSGLTYCTRRMLSQSLNAYFRGEYILTISCLATMWEGMIRAKMNECPDKIEHKKGKNKSAEILAQIIEQNDYERILSDFYENFIVSPCYGVKDVEVEIPNRNGVAHCWYKKYPNQKAALNAILFTDFLIELLTNETAEEA